MAVGYDPFSQALMTGCRLGHASGLPASGWWQRRAHAAMSYSMVFPSLVWTAVSGSEHRAHVRDSRRLTVGMTKPCTLNAPKVLGLPPDNSGQERQSAHK
jgi:hypothetical protein